MRVNVNITKASTPSVVNAEATLAGAGASFSAGTAEAASAVPGTLSLTTTDTIVTEGQTVTVTAARTLGTDGAVAVDWAISPALTTPASGTLEWGAGVSGSQSDTATANLVAANTNGTVTLSNARRTDGGTPAPTLGASSGTITVNDTVAGATPTTMETSVTQYGITWFFSEARPCGQYCNGDWFVVGPVTITSITPISQQISGRWVNGTMVNPVRAYQHGFDSIPERLSYNHSLNLNPAVSGALSLDTGSVVSAISGSYNGGTWSCLDQVAVLTVVEDVPLNGSFRPAPYESDKTAYWRESQLDYSSLQSLAPPSGVSIPDPDVLADSARRFTNEVALPWWEYGPLWNKGNVTRSYGTDYALANSDRLLSLHLNYSNAQKRELMVAMVQTGIDIYGAITRNRAIADASGEPYYRGLWYSNGGIMLGRKACLLLAGMALNDANMLFFVDRENLAGYRHLTGASQQWNLWQEDGSTFYITQGDIDNSAVTQTYLGYPDWSTRYWQNFNGSYSTVIDGDGTVYTASYRWVGDAYVDHSLFARMLDGGVDAWNWQPYFDYCDRFRAGWPNGTSNTQYQSSPFALAMWNTYRADFGPIWSA